MSLPRRAMNLWKTTHCQEERVKSLAVNLLWCLRLYDSVSIKQTPTHTHTHTHTRTHTRTHANKPFPAIDHISAAILNSSDSVSGNEHSGQGFYKMGLSSKVYLLGVLTPLSSWLYFCKPTASHPRCPGPEFSLVWITYAWSLNFSDAGHSSCTE